MKANILIAEDDPAIREGLTDLLTAEGYDVDAVTDGQQALAKVEQSAYHLILLDVMMPGMNGFEVCRRIRTKDSRQPILFLTAKSEEIDQVVGFKSGADDYVTKPFGTQVLLARVEALLRRCNPAGGGQGKNDADETSFAGGRVDHNRFLFLPPSGEEISLTAREVRLISEFADHPHKVLSRDDLLNAVWGIQYYGTTRTLDQHVAQLRKKIEPEPGQPRYLITMHGVGYRYEPPLEG